MRYSNYIFTKGSIVFIKPKNDKESFIKGRPLVVISNPSHLMKTLIVALTGTQDKPGIEVSFYNHNEGKFVGGAEVSKIFPYSLKTIYTDQIVESIGQLDPYIMKEVDKAIDFHLGRSDEVPGYLRHYEDYICGVEYVDVKDDYITNEAINSSFKYPYKPRKEHKDAASSMHKDNCKQSYHHKHVENSIKDEKIKDEKIDDDIIMDWVTDPNIENVNLKVIYNDGSALINRLSEKSVNMIVSRVVPISLIKQKYNIPTKAASLTRVSLTNYIIRQGIQTLNNAKHYRDVNKLPDYVVIGMILAKKFLSNDIKGDPYSISKFDNRINKVIEKYNINLDDGRTWKSLYK